MVAHRNEIPGSNPCLVFCFHPHAFLSYTWSLFYCREDAYWDLKPWTWCQGERGVEGVVVVVGIIMYPGPHLFSHHQLRKKGEGKCGASALLSGTWRPLLVHDLWRVLAWEEGPHSDFGTLPSSGVWLQRGAHLEVVAELFQGRPYSPWWDLP